MSDIPNHVIVDLLFLCRFCIQLFVYFSVSKKHMSELKVGGKSGISAFGLVSLAVLLEERWKCPILQY